MKRLVIIFLLFIGCALAYTPVKVDMDIDNDQTVILSQKNYIIVDHVSDTLSIKKFMVPKHVRRQTANECLARVYQKAELTGRARAIVNIHATTKRSLFPLFRRYEVVITADVVEFVGNQ